MSASKEPDAEELRVAILKSLEGQGFQIEGRNILPPPELSKDKLRQLHRPAVEHRIGRSRARLVRKELILLQRFASGSEVNPTRISPRLVEVQPDSDDELLFRYACLRWSVPVSPGYGRRLRFLILDDFNNKLIGLFGLGDPVFSLEARDKWVGWTTEMRRQRLRHVLDAFVVGAVSPYAELLCGKLVAMLLSCNEVRETFTRKYKGRKSLISGKALDSRVAMVTTMSALGNLRSIIV